MTKEQLEALEDWIVAIVRDEARDSDGSDYLKRCAAKDVVIEAFSREALGETDYGDMTKEDYEAIYGWGGQG